MVVTLTPQLEAALTEQARQSGVTPEVLALEVLQKQLLPKAPDLEPRDEWERKLFEIGIDCGVSIPDWALRREALYE